VSNSGNSANVNVVSADVQVNPDISAKNESTDVVVSQSENDNDNDNDADADAHAGNGNLNLNVGVNESANTNDSSNDNGPQPPLATSRTLWESFGGTFIPGEQNIVWSCIRLPFGVSDPRALVLADACIEDGGVVLEFSELTPGNAHCLSVEPA
jgi:hypothetical protein